MATYVDWVRRAQSSDAVERNQAFDHLVRDFQGMVYGIAYSRLSDQQLAEDAAQEAFLTAYKCITQLQDVVAFPAWLGRIAVTRTNRILRRQGPLMDSIDSSDQLASDEASPEAALEARELRNRVQAAVAALPQTEQVVTRDYYFAGETQREISERLNIPLATVKKRLQYAREHLRGLITGFSETLDRAMYAEPQRQYQPVYIRRRDGRDR